MPQGSLEVFLVNAKGLENTDYLCNMDPYVILICRTQEQKSSVASGQGSEPEWNEAFVFNVSEGVSDLRLKIMDSDSTTAHDLVGEATIPLDGLFIEGNIPPTSYNDRSERCPEENFGGWKESGYRD
ncbi:Elicitor-responsive protein 3 [Glycine max]|nr:Elicitor-responsive protein 3 [Glycine max]